MIPLDAPLMLNHFGGKAYVIHNTYCYGGLFSDRLIDSDLINRLLTEDIAVACSLGDVNSKSSYIVYDIDGNIERVGEAKEEAFRLSEHLKGRGLDSTIFFSGSKGYHVYLFLDSPLSLFTLRNVAKLLLEDFESSDGLVIEVNPKQDRVDYSQESFGNHLKLPFSYHPTAKVHSQQITDYIVNDSDLISGLETNMLIGTDIDMVVSSLIPIWTDGNRHKVTMSVSGFLKLNQIEKIVTVELFKKLLDVSGDKSDVLRVVEDTYNKEEVASLSYCKDITDSMKDVLFSFVSNSRPLSGLRNSIDKVRLAKMATFQKVNKIGNIIYQYFRENYSIYHDNTFVYLCNEVHTLTDIDPSLNRFLHTIGLNTSEQLSRQIITHLTNHILNVGTYIDRYLYSIYNNDSVRVSVDNRSTVVISKKGIETVTDIQPVLRDKPFEYVPEHRNMLSKVLSSFGMTKEDTDIILTWLVSQYFIERMNTKPILLINGTPGSGKTTLASLLLKLVETIESTSVAFSDKRDSMVASLSTHKMLVVDNIEYLSPSMTDFINSVTTGTQIEVRRLYTTNEKVVIKPKCSLCFTSAYNAFDHDSALVSRLVNVTIPKRSDYGIESVWGKLISDRYSLIMSELLEIVQKVLIELDKITTLTTELRISDFIMISRCLENAKVIDTNVERSISKRQLSIKKNNPIYRLMLEVLGDKIGLPFTVESVAIKLLSRARNYGINNLTVVNITHKLLSTGMFEKLESGELVRTY